MYGLKEFVEAGGLMSYGTLHTDLYRRAAAHEDKILPGKNPADVPVEQATRFELVINLKTPTPSASRSRRRSCCGRIT